MRFSPFNPIRFFGDADNTVCGKDFVQVFCQSDMIMFEAIHGNDEEIGDICIYDGDTDKLLGNLKWKRYKVNDTGICSVCEVTGLSKGNYYFKYGDLVSNPVRILADSKSEGTVLIQYACKDNTSRTDVVSKFFSALRYFELRLQGGFKESGWMFKVESEQFTTQRCDIVENDALDYTDKVLTIGTSAGVPVWIADIVNLIFTCPFVFVDGTRYTRSGDSAPDAVSASDNPENVYTILLREAHYINAEIEKAIRLTLRRTPDGLRGASNQFRKVK